MLIRKVKYDFNTVSRSFYLCMQHAVMQHDAVAVAVAVAKWQMADVSLDDIDIDR